ncbi:hypothetical protein Bbelb_174970 [Branchiostoma belcheri]|nr:hypothetical protein Bbelb_174970 [Branchiostoma belcheri]
MYRQLFWRKGDGTRATAVVATSVLAPPPLAGARPHSLMVFFFLPRLAGVVSQQKVTSAGTSALCLRHAWREKAEDWITSREDSGINLLPVLPLADYDAPLSKSTGQTEKMQAGRRRLGLPLFVDALGDQGMWGTQALPTVLNLPLSVIGPAEFTVNRCQDPPMQTLLQVSSGGRVFLL